jgi:nucleotide-binding universal stress UspA family protein
MSSLALRAYFCTRRELQMKRVLLLIHDDPGQEARLIAALAMVRATGAELYCLDVTVSPVMVSACYDPRAEALLEQEEREREAANKTALQARIAEQGVAWRWCDAIGRIASCLRDLAPTADLLVVSRSLESYCDQDMRAVAAELVEKSGRPVLVVPEHLNSLAMDGRVLVAWNGSPQSSRAVRVALPLLHLAQDVILYEVGVSRGRVSIGRVHAFLARQGIKVRVLKDELSGTRAESMLLRAIAAERAEYVIMGGFGRRPFVEALFGGVTRTMLSQSPVPLLLAH